VPTALQKRDEEVEEAQADIQEPVGEEEEATVEEVAPAVEEAAPAVEGKFHSFFFLLSDWSAAAETPADISAWGALSGNSQPMLMPFKRSFSTWASVKRAIPSWFNRNGNTMKTIPKKKRDTGAISERSVWEDRNRHALKTIPKRDIALAIRSAIWDAIPNSNHWERGIGRHHQLEEGDDAIGKRAEEGDDGELTRYSNHWERRLGRHHHEEGDDGELTR
jgi:hypothetical protein